MDDPFAVSVSQGTEIDQQIMAVLQCIVDLPEHRNSELRAVIHDTEDASLWEGLRSAGQMY